MGKKHLSKIKQKKETLLSLLVLVLIPSTLIPQVSFITTSPSMPIYSTEGNNVIELERIAIGTGGHSEEPDPEKRKDWLLNIEATKHRIGCTCRHGFSNFQKIADADVA